MKKRLTKIAPLQLGLFLGVPCAVLGLIAAEARLISLGTHIDEVLILPISYGGTGFFIGVIGALAFNLAAKWSGGIAVTFEDVA